MNISLKTPDIGITKTDGTEITPEEWEESGSGVQQNMANAVVAALNAVEGITAETTGLEVTFSVEKTIVVEETYVGQ